ncbi:7610_t:CDS:2, partial [Racocetra fulgida]
MLKSLNVPVTKILAVHQRDATKAKNADSDTANSLKAETEAGLVNGLIGIIQDILFEENQTLPPLHTAVFIIFDDYKGSTISNLEN